MPLFRIVMRDGAEHAARRYRIEGGSLHLEAGDAGGPELPVADVDLERTLAANAGTDFEPPAAAAAPGAPAAPPAGAAPAEAEATLELVARSEHERGEYHVVEGLVRNCGAGPVSGIVVRAIGDDADGRFVTSEESLVEAGALAPGTEAPWRVILRSDGRVRSVRLGFRGLLGEPLAARGLEPPAPAGEAGAAS